MKRSSRRFVLPLLGVLGACSGAQHAASAPSSAALDTRDRAELDVERLWQDAYGACQHLDITGCTAIYAPGPTTLALGTGPTEVVIGHDAIVDTWKKELALPPGRTLSIRTNGLTANASQDAQTVWTDDQVTWEEHDASGVIARHVVRQTSVLEKIGGRFQVVLLHDSIGVPDDQAIQLAIAGQLQSPVPLPDSIAPGAEGAAKLVKDALEDPLAWEGAIDQGDEVFAIGTAPDDVLRGGATIRTKLSSQRAHFRFLYRPEGGLRAGLAASGTVAWVATNFDLQGEQKGQSFTLPLRLTFVLEKRDGNWKIVQQHLSIPVTEAQEKTLALSASP